VLEKLYSCCARSPLLPPFPLQDWDIKLATQQKSRDKRPDPCAHKQRKSYIGLNRTAVPESVLPVTASLLFSLPGASFDYKVGNEAQAARAQNKFSRTHPLKRTLGRPRQRLSSATITLSENKLDNLQTSSIDLDIFDSVVSCPADHRYP
jgi:hypothetical protein